MHKRMELGVPKRVNRLVALVFVPAVLLGAGVAARAESWPMAPATQAYATAWGADPYQDQDLHVSLFAGEPQAVSFLRFDLASISRNSTIRGLALTLTPNGTAGQNVVPTTQRMAACLETQPFPTQFDPTSTPAFYDCSRLQVTVAPAADGSWKADLTPFVTTWLADGNTGLALVGVDTARDSWIASFDHTKTTALVTYALAAASSGPAAPVARTSRATSPVLARGSGDQTEPQAAAPLAGAPAAAPAIQESMQSSTSTAQSSPLWMYGLVALWSACATLLAVGVVVRLGRAEHFTFRALLAAAGRNVHRRSTWIAGIPLVLVVAGGGTAFGGMVYMNRHVTPPLAFANSLPAGTPIAPDAASAPQATIAPAAAAAAQGPSARRGPAASAGPAVGPQAAASNASDGRWVVGTNSVAGYRIGYNSPTGRGIRVGRTNGNDGVTGEMRVVGTVVQSAQFTVDMRKVACDGGSTCTDHVSQIMDTTDYPNETLVLTDPIDVRTIPADGQQVSESVNAKLTLRGVTRAITFTLNGRRSAGRIEVLGSIPVTRDDYKIPDANEPGFTIDQDGAIEILMVFDHATG